MGYSVRTAQNKPESLFSLHMLTKCTSSFYIPSVRYIPEKKPIKEMSVYRIYCITNAPYTFRIVLF